jgi:carboxypeptidase Q
MKASALGSKALLVAVVGTAGSCHRAPPPSAVELTAASYRDTANRIVAASLASDGAWQKLAYLTDEVGARISGSASLDRAIGWARDTFAKEGHQSVHLERAPVPHWVRGEESATIVGPSPRKLAVLALGGSVGTRPGGLTAEVVVVSSFEELARQGDKVKGKIVLFNHPMLATGNAGLGYRDALPFRVGGADHAAPLGAVAVLVRSLTARSLGAPHTGWMKYAGALKIPAATLSVEDAALIARLAARGETVTVHLALGAETLPDVESANVVAEIRGREEPEEIVVIAAHIDSWDVGQGAQDDGSGCAMVMESLATIRRLGLTPRRTLRAILFTGEEEGRRGAKQYAADHRAELTRYVGAFECDAGIGAPLGFVTDGEPDWIGDARTFAGLLAPIGAASVIPAFAGEDIDELKGGGVPRLGLSVDISHYFDVHHSVADTLDKVDPNNLARGVAALATMAFILADRPGRWLQPPPPTAVAATAPATPARPAAPPPTPSAPPSAPTPSTPAPAPAAPSRP